jgi:hypothetical protein
LKDDEISPKSLIDGFEIWRLLLLYGVTKDNARDCYLGALDFAHKPI